MRLFRPHVLPQSTAATTTPMSSSYVFQVVPADLNALLYMSETTIAWSARRIGNEALATTYEGAAAARRAAMEELLWDEAAGDLKAFFECERRFNCIQKFHTVPAEEGIAGTKCIGAIWCYSLPLCVAHCPQPAQHLGMCPHPVMCCSSSAMPCIMHTVSLCPHSLC